EMLELLSGKQHQVYTGVALILQPENIVKTFAEKTEVIFREVKSGELDR
ncbi:MAG: septum formation inhibitor Maf, partial [candidate division Zixibacteria bacterium]|nr:Maf-like protein [Gammaproteobacteria bacterium]NIR52114.1 Maf-like protein [candidate division KSB1 bacterium]NIR67009.1 Maf-like protein [candidate division Zixibacteria bacterium]NIS48431.1 Maf-like protein [candidate division Zixibacteria bacterium]NIT74325.1 Maf-like protein [candidate division KSB1 bacterium]